MLSGAATLIGGVIDSTIGTAVRLSVHAVELFIIWRYKVQIEGQRGKSRRSNHNHNHEEQVQVNQQQGRSISTSGGIILSQTSNSNSTFSSSSLPQDDIHACHQQAVAGLTLLGQRIPNLMGGYYRPTLQSIYGKPFTTLAAMKQRREAIADNIWLYRFNARSINTSSTTNITNNSISNNNNNNTASVGSSLSSILGNDSQRREIKKEEEGRNNHNNNDIPVLIWLVMPWESEAPIVQRFVLRLAQSLGCNALFITVPLHTTQGPNSTVTKLLSLIEIARSRVQAERLLIGASDLAAMFVLLQLERQYRQLHVGALAAADPAMARRALCQGIILVDPFVGWEPPPPRVHMTQNNINRRRTQQQGGEQEQEQEQEELTSFTATAASSISSISSSSSSSSLSAKERFKELVMNSSGGYIQQWFPSPITYEAPPMIVLVDEAGFWLEEQCAFNARVDRFGIEENESRVFFLPYNIETTAAGTMASSHTCVELERLWRMVEKFLSNQLLREELPTTTGLHSESTRGITQEEEVRRSRERVVRGNNNNNNNNGRSRSRLREGEVTFMAAFAP